jgi:predicted esterase
MSSSGLVLEVDWKEPEPREEAPPTGFVWIERGRQRAFLLVPDEIEPGRRYPLVTVLHGAGRQDEALAKAFRDEPEKRQALFLIPRSLDPTWDLVSSPVRHDMEFLEYAYDLIWRRYAIDPARQALLGYSDGASYALSVGLSNPRLFAAVMGWAAGFKVIDPGALERPEPRPRVLLEYGTHDQLFPFDKIALPMRADLERLGYDVTFRVDEGGRHWPPSDFQPEALDWFFSGPARR